MKKIITTLSLIAILAFGLKAQNCGPIGILNNIPTVVCTSDSAYSLSPATQATGTGVMMQSWPGEWVFDPSTVTVAQGDTIMATIVVIYQDACDGFQEETASFLITNCPDDCDNIDPITVTMPIELPATVCHKDQPINLPTSGATSGTWSGDGVTYGGHFILQTYFDPILVTPNSWATVVYTTSTPCQGTIVLTDSIFVEDCGIDCGTPVVPVILPSTICHDADRIELEKFIIADLGIGWSGDGVTYGFGNDYGIFFDPSLITPDSYTVVTYTGFNDCQRLAPVNHTIYVEDCEPDCGTVEVPLPDDVCDNAGPILIQYPTTFDITGDGIIWGSWANGTYFDPSLIQGTTVATVTFFAPDLCDQWQTVTKQISIKPCSITGNKDDIESVQLDHNLVDNNSTLNVTGQFETADLINSQGKTITSFGSGNSLHIDVEQTGMYYLRFYAEGHTFSKRIMIK